MKKDEVAKKPILDIGEIDTASASDAGADMELLHPISQEPTGIFFTMLGKHGEVFRDTVRERVNKRVKQESLASRKGKPLEPRTAEEVEREAIELLAAMTIGWHAGDKAEQVIPFLGEQLPFNTANALRVYRERLWVREQADAFIGDLENFIKA